MANDCLVTKLKSAVDNSNLEKLGVVKLSIKKQTNAIEMWSNGGSCIVSVLNNTGTITAVSGVGSQLIDSTHAKIANGGIAQGGNITFTGNESIQIEISDKYKLGTLYRVINIENPDSLQYMKELMKIYINQYSSFSPEFELNNLSNCTKCIELEFNSPRLKGNINSLGKLTAITYINIYNAQVTGSIESFVASQRTNGRTTCDSIRTAFGGTSVTFNGQAISGGSEKVLSWTADTITFDGTTIDA
jgi:hypothetical protein